MKIIGIVEKKGNYENTNYHNVNLHCTKLDENAFGEITEVVKIKYSNHSEILGKEYKPSDWQALVGKEIVPMYDRYGKVNFIQFLDNKTA